MSKLRSLLILLWCSIQFATAQAPFEAKLGVSERVFTTSKIYSLIEHYFSGWKAIPDLDLDIAYRNYLDHALADDDRKQFDLTTMEFIARLQNGHTTFEDAWLIKNFGQGLGFYASALDGKWVVQSSTVPQIKAGDVLLKIDDTAVEDFFRHQQNIFRDRTKQPTPQFVLPAVSLSRTI